MRYADYGAVFANGFEALRNLGVLPLSLYWPYVTAKILDSLHDLSNIDISRCLAQGRSGQKKACVSAVTISA